MIQPVGTFMTRIIDGALLANKIVAEVATDAKVFIKQYDIIPCLAVVIVGDDPASHVYVKNKVNRAKEASIKSLEYKLASNIEQHELDQIIESLNQDNNVHGILVQLPLPKHLNAEKIFNTIKPEKDVDGFHPINVGRLSAGQQALVPCTPQGCLIMLQQEVGDLSGKDVVIIGRSNIVGKPMAALLLQQNCTVTIVHSKTKNIQEKCLNADILVAAVGQPLLIKKGWIKPGAIVIDVGINVIGLNEKRKLVGDVDFHEVKQIAAAITPVPGGVGPLTIACLMKNTLKAAKQTTQR